MIAPVSDQSSNRADAPKPRRSNYGKVTDIFLTRLGELESRVDRELGRPASAAGPAGEFFLDVARQGWRLGTDLLGAVTTADGRRTLLADWTASPGVDELGVDAALGESVRELIRPLARRWLGIGESRSATLPDRGGLLVLFNRSAWPLPVEALVLWAFLHDGRLAGRSMAVLVDPDLPELPWVSDTLRRMGVAAATPENATVLLERGAVVVAFPEGLAASNKTYDRRYRLARFEAQGLLAAALESGARIVPAAVVGNEESYPMLGRLAGLPMTAQFPLFGIFGVLPLPMTWTIRLGAALEHTGSRDREGPSVDAIADAVRARMQAILGELLSERV